MPSDVGPSVTSTTVDRYLSTIYCIAGEGETVRPGRLATWLGVSAPTVTEAIQRLARDGWVDVAADRSITLTDEGQRAASAIVRRHRLLERWLVDVLGFDWVRADEEADSLSSGFSDAVIDELDRTLGAPATCPHGNPIPGATRDPKPQFPMTEISEGAEIILARITEQLEIDHDALLYLSDHGLLPGCKAKVRSRAPDGTLTLELIDGTTAATVAIGPRMGRQLYVTTA